MSEPDIDPRDALRDSDEPLVALLRGGHALEVADLVEALGVTATAVRERLSRLVKAGILARERTVPEAATGRGSRGRPAYRYRLTERGGRIGGDNFRDLALVLWREIRSVREPAVRRGLLQRVGRGLAEACRPAIRSGASSASDRLENIAELLRQRRIPCECGRVPQAAGDLPVLTSHACPYPDLAEQDRGICAAECRMLEDLVEAPVRLTECRLDGDSCCRFTVQEAVS
jgi:Predicted transcriptional regulator